MREILKMNDRWKFHFGDFEIQSFDSTHGNVSSNPSWMKSGNNGISKWGYPDNEWQDIQLPHDFACERGEFSPEASASQGSLVKGIGWYRKAFELKEGDRDKTINIELDGVFRNYSVWLNGHLLGTEISGYKSVSYNIDDVCHYDDVNVLAVRVDATEYEGWWYEGAGIYRNVRLVKTAKLHVPQWGTFVTSEVLDGGKAKVTCETTINNNQEEEQNLTLVSQILDAEGTVVAEASENLEIKAYKQMITDAVMDINDATRWDIDNPYLYTLKTLVQVNGETVDVYDTNFGVRTIDYDSENGFYLNGKNIKLKGVCCHEDHAGVGVALPDKLHEYRIHPLKEMGCNAYRSSHNPPTPALLEACDKLGMVFMDETRIMDTCDEYLDQLETLIRRDRNHPSVILWSLGNEEMNIHGTDIGIRIYRHMIRKTKELDTTRKAIYAMNCDWYDISTYNEENGFKVEIGGLNYNLKRQFDCYDRLHASYPDMIQVGTENASTLSTRGLYCAEDQPVQTEMTEQALYECIFEQESRKGIVSGYGEVYPPWGSTPMETWSLCDDRPFVGGVFVWTGFDYRGETIPYSWPATVSHFGIMDLCGFPKDIYYYYKSFWTEEDTLHIFPHWNWEGKEGEPIDVCVFSNMDTVELFLNGESLGTKEITTKVKPTWIVNYKPGTLKAVGYKDGKEVMVKELHTSKKATKVQLEPNKTEMVADNDDVIVMNIRAMDEDGKWVQNVNDLLRFEIAGNAKIIGVGNGNNMSHEHDKLPERKLFHGLAQVIIQSTHEAGNVEFTVKGEGYETQTIKLISTEAKDAAYVKTVTKEHTAAAIIGRRDDADGLV